jgi:hypothetical protein
VESLRVLRTSGSSALTARTATINQIKGMLIAAPEQLRARYRDLSKTPNSSPYWRYRHQRKGPSLRARPRAGLQPASVGGPRPSPNGRVWLRTRHHCPAADHRPRQP